MNGKIVKTIIVVFCTLLFLATAAGVALRNRKQAEYQERPHAESPEKSDGKIMYIDEKVFSGEKIIIEPENASEIVPPVTVREDGSASGGKFIEIREDAGKPPKVFGKAVCSFSVEKKASYRLWGRRWWKDSCGNSVSLEITGGKPVSTDKGTSADRKHVFGEDASYNPELGIPWKWTKGMIYSLDKGTYTFTIHNREDGIRIDQFLFVEIVPGESEYEPVDMETPSPHGGD